MKLNRCLAPQNYRLFSVASTKNSFDNIPPHIWDLTKRKLYKNQQHPLATLINKTESFFNRP
jgi:hypothetical protein